MADYVFRGTREELNAAVKRLLAVMAGKETDPTGRVDQMMTAVGLEVLGKIHDAYAEKSQGGMDQLGITWPPLSQVTLALRRKDSSTATVERAKSELKNLPLARRKLIGIQYSRLFKLYTAAKGQFSDRKSLMARKYARRLVELMKPYIAPGRYKKLVGELSKTLPDPRARRLAIAGATALILRDTGRLLNSLSPQFSGPDRILRVAPGTVTVGSNVRTKTGIPLLALHNSSAPRKLKKDGTPKLPRRQVLPDLQHPMPDSWKHDLIGVLRKQLPDLLKALLQQAQGRG